MVQSKVVPSTILLADDEPNIRRVFEALFTKEGHTVLTAENGKKALDLASAHQIDMLITDLIMPDMSGVEVLQKVRQLHPACSAIIVTAYGSIKSAVEAMRYGALRVPELPPGQNSDRPANGGRRVRCCRARDHSGISRPLRYPRRAS